ncbi:phage lytic cycle repressor MrpR family protein [Bacillus toyonensis]|nr:HNH endonuclease [Bacillus toyonensis]
MKTSAKISGNTDSLITKDNLYNQEFKELFLQINFPKENTRKVKRLHLKKATDLEFIYNKDLYNFTLKELEDLLYSLKAKTLRSLQNTLPTFRRYIQFANEQGIRSSNDTPIEVFKSKDVISKYLNSGNLSKEEIMRIVTRAENPQDGVILALIFDGVSYKNEFEELANLKIDDIDYNNGRITLPNRVISISEETKTILISAIESTEYISIKGNKRKYVLPASEYVLKSPREKKQIPVSIISQRIVRVSKHFDLDFLNATTISDSGQLYYASELLKVGTNIEDVIPSIIKRFNINENASARNKLRSMIDVNLADLQKNTTSYDKNYNSNIEIEIIERDIDAEQAEEDEYYKDGATQYFHGKRYERNSTNRRRAIEIHGLSCKVCDFNFEEVYGKYGKDFIEVHHIKPLSTLNKEMKINPTKDLVPVCANCHRIIHRNKNQILSIEQVKQIIRDTTKKHSNL